METPIFGRLCKNVGLINEDSNCECLLDTPKRTFLCVLFLLLEAQYCEKAFKRRKRKRENGLFGHH